jgi:hypothetical protein
MRSLLSTFAVALAMFPMGLGAIAEDKKDNRLPDKAKSILDKADQVVLFSLEPVHRKKVKDGFHGWMMILGQTAIKGADVRSQILTALYQGIANRDGKGAECFDPRHGIRATANGKTVDLVICFECNWVYVYYDNDENRQHVAETTRDPQSILDKVLKDAGVPLPKQAKD